MKKIIAVVLMLLLLFQFVGCGEAASVDASVDASVEEELQGQWKATLGWGEYKVTVQFDDGNFSYATAYSIWVDKGCGSYEISDDTIILMFSDTNLGDGDLTNYTFIEDKTVEIEYQFEDGELRMWLEDESLSKQTP